jgi:hypothetical protein
MIKKLFIFTFILSFYMAGKANGQDYSAFKTPVIKKISHSDRAAFKKRFKNIKWTGQGLYKETTIDHIPTSELRARLQKVFGKPTQKVGDLIHKKNFRPAEYIEFEYWFTVNDSIPMMILDVDGPFSKGLTYVGASRYIDLMPEVKRTFSKMLMNIKQLAPYKDYFYSPERDKWYLVQYKNGKFSHDQIEQPPGMKPDTSNYTN